MLSVASAPRRTGISCAVETTNPDSRRTAALTLSRRRNRRAVNPLLAALASALLLTACARTGSSGSTGTSSTTGRAPSTVASPAPQPAAASRAPRRMLGNGRVPLHVLPAPLGTGTILRPAGARPAYPVAHAAAPSAADPRPYILGVSVNPSVVGSGTTVHAVVRTTPGVVSVVAFAGGTSMAVPRVGPGLFEGSTTLPVLPSFVHGSCAVTFVARDARGRSTQSAVGVSVR